MKRKFLTIMLSLVATLCLCFGLVGCDFGIGGNTGSSGKEDDDTRHVHSFTDYVYNNDATCTKDGTETATCTCGVTDTRTREGTVLGHDYQKIPAKNATCADAGYDAYKVCQRCNFSTFGGYIPALHIQYRLENGGYTVSDLSSNCSDREIVIPKTYMGKPVTSIKNDAFAGCSELTSIIIPDSVTAIGDRAFWGCSGLTSIAIPDSVTSIGSSAFYGCSGLKRVYIHDLLAWCNIDFRNYESNPLSYAHHLYVDNVELEELTIPNEITEVKPFAFYNCDGLTSIVVPDSVTSIGQRAFSGCSGLTSIEIPDSMTSIENNTFAGCSGLTSVVIPDSVTLIGDGAFWGCSGLTSIAIPDSVTSIGSSAFSGCSGLTGVYISDLAAWCRIDFGPNYLSTENANPLYCAHRLYLDNVELKELIIPNEITEIKPFAFEGCSGLSSVAIGSGVTSIGSCAFYACSGMTSITIPDSVTSIGSYAFCACSGMTSITIPDSVTSIEVYAFKGCSGLTSVTIGSGVTSIGDEAFKDCSELTSVSIPDSVTSIGDEAFGWCDGLTSVSIGSGVTSIGYEAFVNCFELKRVYIHDLLAWCRIDFGYFGSNPLLYAHHLYVDNVELKELAIPDEITEIKPCAFEGCDGLTNITIPDSVTLIGSGAFAGCSGLESITVSPSHPKYSSQNGILYNKERTEFIHIPEAIKGAITIPDGVTSIGGRAFEGCSGLTSIIIPDSVTSIGERAFYGCSELTSVTIGSGVAQIGDYAFSGCSGLASITVSLDNPKYSSQNGILYNKERTEFIHIPKAIKGAITIPDSVTSIGGRAFYGCRGLESVTIGSGVTSIGGLAFYGCSGLMSVAIGSGVTSIGDGAFWNCYELTSVTIGSGATSIGEGAFYGCYGLTSITIPDSVTSIGNYAFGWCGLTEIQFKGTVKEWQTIEKGSEWNYITGDYTITCTDGTIDQYGNVTYFEQ